MTSEVALMNRTGVALAADSAVTVTYWEDGERRQRFFKGANKIFNLSHTAPIGVMINGSSSLQQVPWEILIKAYRDTRGSTAHGHLSEYADDLFDFISSNSDIFPRDRQDQVLVNQIVEVSINILFATIFSDEVKAETDPAAKRAAAGKRLAEIQTEIDSANFLTDEAVDLYDEARSQFRISVIDQMKNHAAQSLITDHLTLEDLADAAIQAFFKPQYTVLDETGVVVAGYGEREYFPQLSQYSCFAVVLGKVIFKKIDSQSHQISHDNVSEIVPIAQSDMMDTFQLGADMNVLGKVDNGTTEAIEEFRQKLIAAGQLDAGFDVSSMAQEVMRDFREKIKKHLWSAHGAPLRRVIGLLSAAELAEIAETLVTIESLKEMVTRPTQSVSGPIDVAVLTKGDGFIWIKRKHYFDASLNPRYLAKAQRVVTER